MKRNPADLNSIDHVMFVIDKSGSMWQHTDNVPAVFNSQIRWLSKRSQELRRETRVTVYFFSGVDNIECVVFDKDAMREPSIAGLYKPGGSTALIHATMKAIGDLNKTYMEYGDHALLTFVLTDGGETDQPHMSKTLERFLGSQPDNSTVAVLVPDAGSAREAQRYGFPAGNISIWDVNKATGVAEAGAVIEKAMETFYELRQSGIRSTNTLFAGSAQQVNAQTVAAAGLTALDPDKFFLTVAAATDKVPLIVSGVRKRTRKDGTVHTSEGTKCVDISALIEATGRQYVVGNAFYELVKKKETVAGNKRIAVVERDTHKVYMGKAARQLIGLGDQNAVVMPVPPDASGKPPFKVFIESQSYNRHVPIGSQVLYLK